MRIEKSSNKSTNDVKEKIGLQKNTKIDFQDVGSDFLEALLTQDTLSEEDKPLSDSKLNSIRDDLSKRFPKEVLQALTNEAVRKNLVEEVLVNYSSLIDSNRNTAEYIVRECVGTGVIEKILTDERITDIGWTGDKLSVETNDNKWLVDGEKLGIRQSYIEQVIAKYAVVNGTDFNSGHPVFDGMFKNVRISATHSDNSPTGATMSLRVARPQLALNKNNFEQFAPNYILELFEKIVMTKANIVISGETGTGKTEFQKLLLSFTNPHDKIIMIEDVPETHASILFPDKEIYSWITTLKKGISDLVKACLRNNPRWIIVSETRGKEAYEMLQAVLSGHFVITTLHAINARAIPRRFVNMCASGYSINEDSVEEDINRYFDFGCHIKKVKINGKVVRYLNEIVEFNGDVATTVFEQKYVNGEFVQKTGFLSESFKERMAEQSIRFEFPSTEYDSEELLA